MTATPFDFGEARDAARRASAAQEAAEKNLIDAARDFAHAEEKYRVALARKIVELGADGVAWTARGDIARGDPAVARLRRDRDIADGVREAMVHAAWRRAADRRSTETFCTWSLRRDLAEVVEPADMPIIGGTRAA